MKPSPPKKTKSNLFEYKYRLYNHNNGNLYFFLFYSLPSITRWATGARGVRAAPRVCSFGEEKVCLLDPYLYRAVVYVVNIEPPC